MKRHVVLSDAEHQWLLTHLEGLLAKAKANISVWCDRMPEIQRVRDAVGSAMTLEEKASEAAQPPTPKRRGRPAGVAPPPVGIRTEQPKKPRAPRGSRLATLPKLCPEHPAYGARRRPRTDCQGCWSAFERYNDPAFVDKVLRDVGRKRGVVGG